MLGYEITKVKTVKTVTLGSKINRAHSDSVIFKTRILEMKGKCTFTQWQGKVVVQLTQEGGISHDALAGGSCTSTSATGIFDRRKSKSCLTSVALHPSGDVQRNHEAMGVFTKQPPLQGQGDPMARRRWAWGGTDEWIYPRRPNRTAYPVPAWFVYQARQISDRCSPRMWAFWSWLRLFA